MLWSPERVRRNDFYQTGNFHDKKCQSVEWRPGTMRENGVTVAIGRVDARSRNANNGGRARRLVHLDVARGIAVFGILAVNIWSFVWGFEYLRYGVLPDAPSLMDRLAVFAVALTAEQKFYPIFAFLFGAGFALQTRSLKKALPDWRGVQARYRGRLRWLLGLGMMHGTLVWAGDILTVYGIAGFFIVGLAGARLKTVRARLWKWCAVWFLLIALSMLLSRLAVQDADVRGQTMAGVESVLAAHVVYTQGGVVEYFVQRLGDYIAVTGASVFLLPHVLVLFMLGILSVRLGWLTAPWRHAVLWRRVRAVGYGIGIPFNILWASVAVAEAADPLQMPAYGTTVYALLPIGGSLLAAAYVASVMLAREKALRWLAAWLAPVGRMSLTNYLAQSVLGVVLLQGVGLGLGKAAATSPALLLGIAAAIMLCQACFSRWWMLRHRQGPVESLYRHRQAVGDDAQRGARD